ncbi:MAG: hypothetical protein M3173_01955, partial [Chloroflexota bacterium]|nr:hypothetical protein [Chloroflexota bacterium]
MPAGLSPSALAGYWEGVHMRSEVRRPIRPLVVVCLVSMLLTGGASTLAAQGAIDPNADSDLDGMKNSMDADDDNDGVYDDQDYYPLDPTRWQQEAAPTPTPVTVYPTPTPVPASPPTPTPAPPPPPTPVSNQKPDFDGDGNPDLFDPDDDNDGIVDEHDADPFNAAVGVAPTPSTIDPGTDNDADGVANSHDPDDD